GVRYSPGQSFNEAKAVNLTIEKLPGEVYLGSFVPSMDEFYYTFEVTGVKGSIIIRDIYTFSQQSLAKVEKTLLEESEVGGSVEIDKASQEFSGLEIDAGGLSYSTGTVDFSDLIGGFFSALPNVRVVKDSRVVKEITDRVKDVIASNVYTISLERAQQNKSVTLSLKYDKTTALDPSTLRVMQYDEALGDWKLIPAEPTVDPVNGVVYIDVESISKAYGSDSPNLLARSIVKDGVYAFNPNASQSQVGKFVVVKALPSTNVSYTGAEFKLFNFPNPFQLKSKSITYSQDVGSLVAPSTTRGTIIKYMLPSNKGGSIKLLLYNIAGELVREIDEGNRTGGYIYYAEWDGRNSKGEDCASGVYLLQVVRNNNEVLNKTAHKMVLIK
ncbi:MAG: hypothetical protein NZ870_03155, partial [bacterium]|nr:hypothetical protein [bacterium]